jgi:hypothetical protein
VPVHGLSVFVLRFRLYQMVLYISPDEVPYEGQFLYLPLLHRLKCGKEFRCLRLMLANVKLHRNLMHRLRRRKKNSNRLLNRGQECCGALHDISEISNSQPLTSRCGYERKSVSRKANVHGRFSLHRVSDLSSKVSQIMCASEDSSTHEKSIDTI